MGTARRLWSRLHAAWVAFWADTWDAEHADVWLLDDGCLDTGCMSVG